MEDDITVVVTSVFGDARSTKVYVGAYDGRDGFACPFCQSVTVRSERWPRCDNPWCNAAVHPRDKSAAEVRQRFLDAYHEAAIREDESRRRERDAEWRRKYQAEEAAARNARVAELRAEAERRGVCMECFFHSLRCYTDRPKYVKHRGECPIVARRRA